MLIFDPTQAIELTDTLRTRAVEPQEEVSYCKSVLRCRPLWSETRGDCSPINLLKVAK